jgi:formylmethanofuran dehydrogenase subunit C
MKQITLTLRKPPALGLEAENISPDVFAGKSKDEIGDLTVFHGTKEHPLTDFFNVDGSAAEKPEDTRIVVEGDLSKVKRVGQGMTAGEILIKGNVGLYVGAEMRGGRIVVEGDAGAFAGQQMRGGELIIRGNAGNYLGSSYRGNWRGMRGGTIIVEGSAGSENGEFMLGGKIHIKGDCGPFVGLHMKKGLIVVEGAVPGRAGAQMIGGTIVVNGRVDNMLPSFKLLGERENVSIDGETFEGVYLEYSGDHAEPRAKGRLYLRKQA